MAIENVFSWSKSRNEQFRECQRKYFYDKYASWGGWEPNASDRTRLAYVLKNLKNRWAWKGETVHHVIENVLKAAQRKKPLSLEEAVEQLTGTMRQDFRSSKQRKYFENPKTHIGLFEHEYQKPVSDAIWQKIHEESVSCLRHFYGSDLYRELLSDDVASWLLVENLEEYQLGGVKIFVKLDFARRKEGFIEIYDWKTGKNEPEGTRLQIGTYALYATQKWAVPVEKIRAFLFNLSQPLPKPQEQPVDAQLIDSTRQIIMESVGAMHELLEDPAKNIPKSRENFRFTENTRLCDYCNFYKICEKWN